MLMDGKTHPQKVDATIWLYHIYSTWRGQRSFFWGKKTCTVLKIQWTFNEHSMNIQWTLNFFLSIDLDEHSMNIDKYNEVWTQEAHRKIHLGMKRLRHLKRGDPNDPGQNYFAYQLIQPTRNERNMLYDVEWYSDAIRCHIIWYWLMLYVVSMLAYHLFIKNPSVSTSACAPSDSCNSCPRSARW